MFLQGERFGSSGSERVIDATKRVGRVERNCGERVLTVSVRT